MFETTEAQSVDCAPLRVALDIGHSPIKSGTKSSTGKTEYYFNKRFVEELVDAAKVYPSLKLSIVNREGRDIPLKRRVGLATDLHASLFLSIHHDSMHPKYWKTKVVAGRTYTYSYAFRGYSIFVSKENPALELSIRAAKAIGRRFKSKGMTVALHHAEPIQGEGRELLDADLGVYEAPFAVLRHAPFAAVLLELGVLINPDEEQQLEKAEYRAAMAAAILEALTEYCGSAGSK